MSERTERATADTFSAQRRCFFCWLAERLGSWATLCRSAALAVLPGGDRHIALWSDEFQTIAVTNLNALL